MAPKSQGFGVMRTDGRDAGWSPPHCPNPKCIHHNHFDCPWPFRRRGSFTRPSDGVRVPRAECRTCGVTFSTQTFSTTYWLKRPDLLQRIVMRLVGGMCARQIARDVGCSPETVNRLIARLGRHCMLVHMQLWRQAPPQGPLVIDGFESFEFSQYHPIHHHVVVETETGFLPYHTDSELRRKGRMTPAQRERRAAIEARHGRPDPQSIRKDVQHLLEVTLTKTDQAHVHSDDHRSYPPAIRAVPCRIRHTVTSSKVRRTARNPLFPVNELDLLIRHSQANHKRETIAFSKRRQGSAERLSILSVWRNYVKWHREKQPGRTPAMKKGLLTRRLSIREILNARLFPGRIALPERWQQYYDRAITTRELAVNRRHELKYAY
jgi:transposase-like protein